MAIDKSDFEEWGKNPITKEIIEHFNTQRVAYSEYIICNDKFLNPAYNHVHDIAHTAYLKGAYAVYKQLSELTFDQFLTLNPQEETKGGQDETSPS